MPNLAPDQTRYAAPLLSLPESPERFHLQTPNTDTSYEVVQREPYALLPRHDFFSLDAGALIILPERQISVAQLLQTKVYTARPVSASPEQLPCSEGCHLPTVER